MFTMVESKLVTTDPIVTMSGTAPAGRHKYIMKHIKYVCFRREIDRSINEYL